MAIQQHCIRGATLIPGRNGSALVASKSHPGTWHLTTTVRCDCSGFSNRATCRHLRAVRAFSGREDVNRPSIDELVDGLTQSYVEWRERRHEEKEQA